MPTFSVYALVGVDEQSTRHTSTPMGRFVLRADAIRPYRAYALNRVLAKKTGLRADSIRPYKAYAFIRVLAKILGCGHL